MAVSFDEFYKANPEKGLAFLRKAVLRENPDAAFRLGMLYGEGDDLVGQSEAKSTEMFRKAALWNLNLMPGRRYSTQPIRALNNRNFNDEIIKAIEAKIEIEGYLIELTLLYKEALYKDYKSLSDIFSNMLKRTECKNTDLNFTPDNIPNIIPLDMFDDTEKNEVDDFDKLLRDFIDSELNDIKPFDEDAKRINNDVPISITYINVAYDFDKECNGFSIHRNYFRKGEGENLHIEMVIENPLYEKECWGFDTTIEIVSESGVVWARGQESIFIESDKQEHSHIVTFKQIKLAEDSYKVRFKYNGQSDEFEFSVIDIPGPYVQSIDVLGMSLFRFNSDEDCPSFEGKDSYSCFDKKNLQGVEIVMQFENILHRNFNYEAFIKVYNELGELLITNLTQDEAISKDSGSNLCTLYFPFIPDSIICGTYKLVVEFFDDVIASADFVIGNRDVFGTGLPN